MDLTKLKRCERRVEQVVKQSVGEITNGATRVLSDDLVDGGCVLHVTIVAWVLDGSRMRGVKDASLRTGMVVGVRRHYCAGAASSGTARE